MPKFKVEVRRAIKRFESMTVEVEAASEEEAKEIVGNADDADDEEWFMNHDSVENWEIASVVKAD